MLLQWGTFQLHSGQESWYRIDCDAFSASEIYLIGHAIAGKVGRFTTVTCPRSHHGSNVEILKHSLEKYITGNFNDPILIVDDVLTTGSTMEALKKEYENFHREIKGAVIFSRGPCPEWITPLFEVKF